MRFPRSSGVLLHPTALPGPWGIGDLGPAAYQFVDFLAAAGQSNREIGQALGISDRTVERHLTAIFGALGVDRRSAAVARAAASGLLTPPSL